MTEQIKVKKKIKLCNDDSSEWPGIRSEGSFTEIEISFKTALAGLKEKYGDEYDEYHIEMDFPENSNRPWVYVLYGERWETDEEYNKRIEGMHLTEAVSLNYWTSVFNK